MKKKLLSISLLSFLVVSPLLASELGNQLLDPNVNWNSWLPLSCSSSSEPEMPWDVVATPASTSSIEVSWSATDDATSYRLYRNENSAFTGATLKIYDGTSTWYTDSGLPSATYYYYYVKAVETCPWTTDSSESAAPNIPASARTDAPPVTLTWATSTWEVATAMTNAWNFTLASSWVVEWQDPITISSWWLILPPIKWESTNSVEVTNNSSQQESATAQVTFDTDFTFMAWTWGSTSLAATISPPVLQSVDVASELSGTKDVVSVTKVWVDNQIVAFKSSTWAEISATLRLPAPWLSAWDTVNIDYSIDWVSWTSLSNGTVVIIWWKPYVIFETTHFTYFSIWKPLAACTDSDFNIWSWGTCSSSTQSRTATKKSASTCNSTAYSPATSQSCTSTPAPSGGGWWWGWAAATPACALNYIVCSGWLYQIKSWLSCRGGYLWQACTVEKKVVLKVSPKEDTKKSEVKEIWKISETIINKLTKTQRDDVSTMSISTIKIAIVNSFKNKTIKKVATKLFNRWVQDEKILKLIESVQGNENVLLAYRYSYVQVLKQLKKFESATKTEKKAMKTDIISAVKDYKNSLKELKNAKKLLWTVKTEIINNVSVSVIKYDKSDKNIFAVQSKVDKLIWKKITNMSDKNKLEALYSARNTLIFWVKEYLDKRKWMTKWEKNRLKKIILTSAKNLMKSFK